MNKNIQKIMTGAMAVSMMAPTMTMAAVKDSDTAAVQSATAKITLHKVVTVNQDNKFPNIPDYKFNVTAEKAWYNDNVSTTATGTTKTAADAPLPAASTTEHHQIANTGTTSAVTIGDFTTKDGADSVTQKDRSTTMNITYTKAGYYMYKVVEQANGGDTEARPGMTYDTENSYYIMVYVANKIDAQGNTADGVYVRAISSYRNSEVAGAHLADISSVTDVAKAIGKLEKENADGTGNGKIGASTPDKPNEYDQYYFWNDQETKDIVVTENVRGNLGDRTKEFEQTIVLTGLEKGVTYTTDIATPEGVTSNVAGAKVSASVGTWDQAKSTITADASGKATITVKMKDDDKFVINSLPAGANYQVTQASSDHIASYTVTGEGTAPEIVKAADNNNANHKSIATATELVNANVGETDEGTVTVALVDTKDLTTITGVAMTVAPFAAIAMLAGFFVASRKKNSLEM